MARRISFYTALALAAFYCLGPFLWQALTSLKPAAQLTALPPLLPSPPTVRAYLTIFEDPVFLRIILNSLVVASASTILSLALGAPAAFALAWLGVRRRGLILAFVLSASMFPPIATVSPLFLVIRELGMRDTLTSLVIVYTTFTLPLTVWALTSFFGDIPAEIYKASRVDGCSAFQSFYRIMLPLSGPGLAATAILVFIFSWNEFLFALTFTSTPASRTIPVGIALFPGVHEAPWGEIAAASVVVTLPLVVLVFAFQRRIVEGITAGAVKG